MTSQCVGQILVVTKDTTARANLRNNPEKEDFRTEEATTSGETPRQTNWWRFRSTTLDPSLSGAPQTKTPCELQMLAPDRINCLSELPAAMEAIPRGKTDFLLKPVDPAVLCTSLRRVDEQTSSAHSQEHGEAAFRHLIGAAEAMIVILRPDNKIVYFSPHAERLTGYAAHEVHDLDFSELFMREPERSQFRDRMESGGQGRSVPGHQKLIICRDGSQRWIVWNSCYLENYGGGPAIMGIGQDATGLRHDQAQLLRSERLAAIGQVVTGLAHESRNAMQRSQACLEMLAIQVADRPEALHLISRLQLAQNHLQHLYEDVRQYASPIKLQRSRHNLCDIWREVWSNLGLARKGQDVVLREEVDNVDLACTVDPFHIGQIFHNILENSLAAGPGTSEIVIQANDSHMEGQPALQVNIRNNGPGIDPEQHTRIFDPFFTTKTKGTGLGLALVKRVVEAHEGWIALAGPGGPGAEFIITLPRNLP